MANVNFAKWVRMKGRAANPVIHRTRLNGGFPWLERPGFVWECEIAIGDFTGEGDTSQDLDLDALYPGSPFINNVWLEPGAHIVPLVAFAGGAVNAVTLALGDAGAFNGLVTASSVFSGVTIGSPIATPAATEYALRYESSFRPQVRIVTTNGNVSALEDGRALVRIPFTPAREV